VKRFAPDGAVLRAFMASRSLVKIIQGPVGSGTSSACCMHIYQQAMMQPRQADGRQRFRAHVFRETYSKLEETTIRTWKDWFTPGTGPDQFGRFYESKPYLHEIRVGPLELDVIFMAIEDITDGESYFKSLETSLIWFNEGQYAQWAVIKAAVERVSPPRFPAVKDGGCAWGGMIIDTNSPPADHWIPLMRGDTPLPEWMNDDQRRAMVKPAAWEFFMQPPGLVETFDGDGKTLTGYRPNPRAENLAYLAPDFYMLKTGGQDKAWIDANIMNRSSVVTGGKPVYPAFRRDVHVAKEPLKPVPGVRIVVGVDFGRQPAAIYLQHLREQWLVLREFIGQDMGATTFGPLVKADLMTHYPDWMARAKKDKGDDGFAFWGDPSGEHPGEVGDTTPFDIFRGLGMLVRPAPGENLNSARKEAVESLLTRRTTDQKPSLLVDPRCVTFISGMGGGYHYKRLQVSTERYSDEPLKNQYSHVCEALEYGLLGGGEGRAVVMRGSERPKPVQTVRPYQPFRQQGGVRW
jgi:hypothetical protein